MGKGRRTNLALLVVLVAALVTGALAFAARDRLGSAGGGRPPGRAGRVVVAPGSRWSCGGGLAGRSARWASVAFGVLVLVAVAAGLAHTTGAAAGLGPVSAMQVHVGAALALPPCWSGTPPPAAGPGRTDLSRRACCGPASSPAGRPPALAVEGATRLAGLPGACRCFTGSLPLTDPARSR